MSVIKTETKQKENEKNLTCRSPGPAQHLPVVFLPRQWAAGGGRRVLRRGHAPVRLPGRRLALARPGISSPRPPLSIPSDSSLPPLGSFLLLLPPLPRARARAAALLATGTFLRVVQQLRLVGLVLSAEAEASPSSASPQRHRLPPPAAGPLPSIRSLRRTPEPYNNTIGTAVSSSSFPLSPHALPCTVAPFPTKAESSSPPVMSSPSLWCLFHALELGIELLEPPGV